MSQNSKSDTVILVRNFLKITSSLTITFVLFFLGFNQIKAQDTQLKVINVSQDEVINKNPYFAAGEVVNISGTVNGDVYAAGNSVTISGKVNGDVYAAGNTIRISGEVSKNVYAVGNTIALDNKIGGKTLVAGNTIDLSKTSQVAGYLMAAGNNLKISSLVTGNLYLAGNYIALDSIIRGDINATAASLSLLAPANVTGNVDYWSHNDASVEAQVKVSGNIQKHLTTAWKGAENFKTPDLANATAAFRKFMVIGNVIGFISAFIIGSLLIHFIPKIMLKASSNISRKFWASFGIGFITLALTPIAFIFLLVTIIGIPIAFILGVIVPIALYFTKIFVSYWLGRKILTKGNIYLSYGLGLLIFFTLASIPFLTMLIKLLTACVGLGAILLTKNQIYKEAKQKEII